MRNSAWVSYRRRVTSGTSLPRANAACQALGQLELLRRWLGARRTGRTVVGFPGHQLCRRLRLQGRRPDRSRFPAMSATEVLERVNRTENPGGRSERGNWLRRHRPDRGADLRGATDRPDAGSPCRPCYCRPARTGSGQSASAQHRADRAGRMYGTGSGRLRGHQEPGRKLKKVEARH